jgi:hypothetical protein
VPTCAERGRDRQISGAEEVRIKGGGEDQGRQRGGAWGPCSRGRGSRGRLRPGEARRRSSIAPRRGPTASSRDALAVLPAARHTGEGAAPARDEEGVHARTPGSRAGEAWSRRMEEEEREKILPRWREVMQFCITVGGRGKMSISFALSVGARFAMQKQCA